MSPSKEIKNNSLPPKGEWEKGLSQSPRNAYIYILRCSDDTYYTGVTYDLTRRLMDHNEWKKWAKYTRGRRPLELVYQESLETYGSALSREYEIKKLPRASKEELIRQYVDLEKEIYREIRSRSRSIKPISADSSSAI